MSNKVLGLRVFWVGVSLFFFSLEGGAYALSPSQDFNLKVQADQLLKEGRTEQAISLYETVLKKDKGFANAHYNLATAYYLKGELGKAAQSLKAFLHLQPNDAEALYNLGCLKIRLGDFDEAMKCFLRAENCPCTRLISGKIKEALRFTKGLRHENPQTRELISYLLTSDPSPGNG